LIAEFATFSGSVRFRVVVALVVLVTVSGCARNDGRTMTAPLPGATTPPPTTTAQAGTASSVAPFTLSSPAFTNGAALPVDVTCDGAGEPPALTWTAPPTGTAELAIVLTDADQPETALWVVAGLPPQPFTLAPGALPAGAVDLGYEPPCPPRGDAAHVYLFTLYALTSPLGLGTDADPAEVLRSVNASPAQVAQLTGFDER
jgi:phosphatidylethanolamine-binding protein (PEBP) family uncharacterized protein